MIAALFFKEDPHSSDLSSLHGVEFYVLCAEILLILMLFVSLLLGSSYQQGVAVAFYSGVWAKFFYLGSFAAVVGVLLLRVFILYAGQTYSI